MTGFEISVSNRQRTVAADAARVREAAREAAIYAGGPWGNLSVVLVGDRAMRRLNREFAKVRGTTDVLAFDLSEGPRSGPDDVAGEVVVNASLAAAEAKRRGGRGVDELLLYVVHGVLHLGGYRDGDAAEKRAMRAAERAVTARIAGGRGRTGGGG